MTLSMAFHLGASLAMVILVGILVVRAFPSPGWQRYVFLVALAAQAVLVPLRFLAYVDSPEWILADELQLAMFVTFWILFATSDRSRIRRERAAAAAAAKHTVTS